MGSPPLPSVGRRAVNSRIREWINTFDDKRSGGGGGGGEEYRNEILRIPSEEASRGGIFGRVVVRRGGWKSSLSAFVLFARNF